MERVIKRGRRDKNKKGEIGETEKKRERGREKKTKREGKSVKGGKRVCRGEKEHSRKSRVKESRDKESD